MPTRVPDPRQVRLEKRAVQLHAQAQEARAKYLALTREAQDAVYDAWQAGASPTELGEAMGIGRVRVYQLMDKAEQRRAEADAAGDGSKKTAKTG